MKPTVELQGFGGVEEALVELEQLSGRTTLGKNAVMRGLRKSMKRIEDAAKAKVPVDEGDLRDSITTKKARARRIPGSRKFERQTGIDMLTGPTGRQQGGVGAFQEFGTVNMPANPFMRPAADSEGQAVVDEVIDVIRDEVAKTAARARKKAAKGK
ncbi:HK97 gp10 family phage protein [Qipengyuania sp. 6B39]|uniref:HK97-gp10 family putative phage morphogenesis protein n=1 Tax=Qipengyuania proteolytica TaxID=2867239 RepID=UPI001C8AABC1|nr:HK97-gp10 family putative phage morphogenesis protein [Qipengyuania proteolytica]MBX7496764.1 HK97 gp10 family phage protein [Qipengyuania proteolytica]